MRARRRELTEVESNYQVERQDRGYGSQDQPRRFWYAIRVGEGKSPDVLSNGSIYGGRGHSDYRARLQIYLAGPIEKAGHVQTAAHAQVGADIDRTISRRVKGLSAQGLRTTFSGPTHHFFLRF